MKIIGGKWNTFQTPYTLGRRNLKPKLFVNDAVTIMMILPCLSFLPLDGSLTNEGLWLSVTNLTKLISFDYSMVLRLTDI